MRRCARSLVAGGRPRRSRPGDASAREKSMRSGRLVVPGQSGLGRPNPLTTTTITMHTSLPEVQFATRKRKRDVMAEEEWESPAISPSVVNTGFAVAFAVFGVCVWAAKLLK
jgi:hypothetical protein